MRCDVLYSTRIIWRDHVFVFHFFYFFVPALICICVCVCVFARVCVCMLADGLSAGQPDHCEAVTALILAAQLSSADKDVK